MLPTCQNASIIMIMAEITSGDMKKSVEDQEARHHFHCRTLVLQVVEGDWLKYERGRHKIEMVQIYFVRSYIYHLLELYHHNKEDPQKVDKKEDLSNAEQRPGDGDGED